MTEEEKEFNNEIINSNEFIYEKLIDERKKNIIRFELPVQEDDELKPCFGSGSLCKIYINNNPMPVLITCYHVLNYDDYVKINQYLNFSYFVGKEKMEAFLDLSIKRIIYQNKDLDIVIIEIKEEDKLDIFSFLEIDDSINLNNPQLMHKEVYLLHYPDGEEDVYYSQGEIINIKNNFLFRANYSTRPGSSGSPIIDYEKNIVIGMHQKSNGLEGLGIILKYAIKSFIEEKLKEIEYQYKNLYSYKDTIDLVYINPNSKEKKIKILGNNFVKRYKYICTIIYNGIEYPLNEKLDIPETDKNKPEIKIKLKGINNYMKDLSYMFGRCPNLKKVDASGIDTSNVLNMEAMFEWCENLEEISDMSRWNVENVRTMKGLFYQCKKLTSVPGIEKWNPLKLEDCRELFLGCEKIPVSEIAKIENWKNVPPKVRDLAKKGFSTKNILAYALFENLGETLNYKNYIKKKYN